MLPVVIPYLRCVRTQIPGLVIGVLTVSNFYNIKNLSVKNLKRFYGSSVHLPVTSSCRGSWWTQLAGRSLSAAGGCSSLSSATRPAVRGLPCAGRGRFQRLTQQILKHWTPFQVLQQAFAVSRRAEQLCLRTPQRIVATADDSVLRTEMGELGYMRKMPPSVSSGTAHGVACSWLGSIRPHRRDEAWSASLWHTFFSLAVGAQIRVPPLARRT